MAYVKRLSATYYCETDADRDDLNPHKGETCIMKNGDVYACFDGQTWTKTEISGGGGGGGNIIWDPIANN